MEHVWTQILVRIISHILQLGSSEIYSEVSFLTFLPNTDYSTDISCTFFLTVMRLLGGGILSRLRIGRPRVWFPKRAIFSSPKWPYHLWGPTSLEFNISYWLFSGCKAARTYIGSLNTVWCPYCDRMKLYIYDPYMSCTRRYLPCPLLFSLPLTDRHGQVQSSSKWVISAYDFKVYNLYGLYSVAK